MGAIVNKNGAFNNRSPSSSRIRCAECETHHAADCKRVHYIALATGVAQNTVKASTRLILATQNEEKRLVNRHSKMLNYLYAQMSEEQKAAATQLATQCKSQQLQGC